MKIIVANPRGFCAGVEMAVRAVELSLERFGRPLYVKHAIVHNAQVVKDLENRGAIFVESVYDVPNGSVVVFSAHGSPPRDFDRAAQKGLLVINAECPLVTKVHNEVRRYARDNLTVILVGHRNHVEVKGTEGEAPEHVLVVETVDEARTVRVPDPHKVAYATQTTLSVDETSEIVAILKERFPDIVGPQKAHICYATQNRQDAVKRLTEKARLIFIVGSPESSNSNRLVEVARGAGATAHLVSMPKDIDVHIHEVKSVSVVGISAGASTPERAVKNIILKIISLVSEIEIHELPGVEEKVHFALPKELGE